MVTLYELCRHLDYKFARNNFIDLFTQDPSYEMIKDSILEIDSINLVQKSMLAATVDMLCSMYNVQRPDWIFDKSVFLNTPYFAMNAKGPLRIILLQESPKYFRARNLFVTANCIERV